MEGAHFSPRTIFTNSGASAKMSKIHWYCDNRTEISMSLDTHLLPLKYQTLIRRICWK